MPAGRPWYQRNPADFIMAVRGWDLEMAGAYSLIIDHLNDRDRPLPNDDRFMAGLLGCSAQRWRKIRDFLIDHEKLVITDDDYLTNPRFEREHAARYEDRERAVSNGRAGGLISAAKRAGQTELDFEPDSRAHARTAHAHGARARSGAESGKELQKIGQNFSNSSATSLAEPEQNIVENQSPPPSPPSSSVRARESRVKRRDSSHPNNGALPRVRAHEDDLETLTAACCEAAGLHLTDRVAIDRAMRQVERWRSAGFDFDGIVLPTIRAATLKTDEPSRLLSRFTRAVEHQHAKRNATVAKGQTYTPPEGPKLTPPDEDPALFPLRTDLLEALGERSYCLTLNRVRFEDGGAVNGDKHPLRVAGPAYLLEPLRQGPIAKLIRKHARDYGFTDVWCV